MRTNYFILIAFILLAIQFNTNAQNNEEIFTIYLVRHAEKDLSNENSKNPVLTICGEQRSESLSVFFSNVDLKHIYSTDYTRTIKTAEPTANVKGLQIEIYDQNKLKLFAKLLIKSKKDALVIGHSNTTVVLAGLLTDKKMGSFDESIYNRIYQVVIHKKVGHLQLFHTAFKCNE